MKLTAFNSPSDFLSAAQTELEKQEVLNSLILGITRRLAEGGSFGKQPPYFAAVMDGEELLAAAFMTPPHPLGLAAGHRDIEEALSLIASDLHDKGLSLPAVIGPNPISETFARIWAQRTGQQHELAMPQLLYELHAVTPPTPQAAGVLRLAKPNESDLLTEWLMSFDQDAFGMQVRTAEAAYEFIEVRIQDGDVYVWDDGAPVSMVMSSRPTRHGITVNMVYTPPELRRRGYASASVAALSQLLLDQGFDFCTLFTDAANPTSNKIYQDIGYKIVSGFDKFSFNRKDT